MCSLRYRCSFTENVSFIQYIYYYKYGKIIRPRARVNGVLYAHRPPPTLLPTNRISREIKNGTRLSRITRKKKRRRRGNGQTKYYV